MKTRSTLSLLIFVVTVLWLGSAALAQGAAAGKPPPDPWPRVVDLTNGQVLVYQPQVNKWNDNQIDFRAALAIKPDGRQGRDLRRHLRHRAHAGRQGAAHRGLREPEDLEDRLPDAAGPRRRLQRRAADGVRARRAHDLARPARGLAGAGRHQAADGRGAEQPAAGDRQLLAGDPGADRRRAGAEAGAGPSARPARHQHARADPAGRLRRQVLHPRLRRLARSRARSPGRGRSRAQARSASATERHRADALEERRWSTCSTAAPRPIRSPRSPTACRRSTPARCRPS